MRAFLLINLNQKHVNKFSKDTGGMNYYLMEIEANVEYKEYIIIELNW